MPTSKKEIEEHPIMKRRVVITHQRTPPIITVLEPALAVGRLVVRASTWTDTLVELGIALDALGCDSDVHKEDLFQGSILRSFECELRRVNEHFGLVKSTDDLQGRH